MEGNLVFDGLTLHARKIGIDGRRSAGEDVFFEHDLQAGSLDLQEKPVVTLDLPQGIYNRLEFSLVFDPDPQSEEELGGEIDDLLKDLINDVLPPQAAARLGDVTRKYQQEAEPAFIYTGIYKNQQTTFDVVLVLNDPLTMNVVAENGSGQREITIQSDQTNRGNLSFDPAAWFTVVPQALMENAVKGVVNGKEYVLIHKKVNPGLFNMVYNRIERSTTLVINE